MAILNHPPMGVITTGVVPNSEAIGAKRPGSIWANKLDVMAFTVEILHQEAKAAYDAVGVHRATFGEAEYQRAIVYDPERSVKGLTADDLVLERAEADANVARAKKSYEDAVARNREANRRLNIARRHLRRCQLLYQQTDTFVPVAPEPIKGTYAEAIAQNAAKRIEAEKAPLPQSEGP